ncbi:MAG: hypothetical protein WDN46_10385 [Methylocella sp.]
MADLIATPPNGQIAFADANGRLTPSAMRVLQGYAVSINGTQLESGATQIPVSNTGVSNTVGAGSPEGVITAPPGSTYVNTSGGAGSTFFVKESGEGNTGWQAK